MATERYKDPFGRRVIVEQSNSIQVFYLFKHFYYSFHPRKQKPTAKMIFNKALIVAFLAAMGATANPIENRGAECDECDNGGGHHGGGGGGGGGSRAPSNSLCPTGLYSSPQCCAADVIGVAGVDCEVPGESAKNGKEFARICSKKGKAPKCCVLGLVSLILLLVRLCRVSNTSPFVGRLASSLPGCGWNQLSELRCSSRRHICRGGDGWECYFVQLFNHCLYSTFLLPGWARTVSWERGYLYSCSLPV